ncbi:MAG TPA: hypothetical protein VMT32_16085 [Bryobacteraceae bacterium]|nr:hypothetical protein [Bryobacteraceae bacterium]
MAKMAYAQDQGQSADARGTNYAAFKGFFESWKSERMKGPPFQRAG